VTVPRTQTARHPSAKNKKGSGPRARPQVEGGAGEPSHESGREGITRKPHTPVDATYTQDRQRKVERSGQAPTADSRAALPARPPAGGFPCNPRGRVHGPFMRSGH
jgi:hypothetical protein